MVGTLEVAQTSKAKNKDARGLGKKAMPSLSPAPARFSHQFQDLCPVLSWSLEQARVEMK